MLEFSATATGHLCSQRQDSWTFHHLWGKVPKLPGDRWSGHNCPTTEAHKQLLEAQKLLPEDKRVGGLRLQQHAATINNHQHPVKNPLLNGSKSFGPCIIIWPVFLIPMPLLPGAGGAEKGKDRAEWLDFNHKSARLIVVSARSWLIMIVCQRFTFLQGKEEEQQSRAKVGKQSLREVQWAVGLQPATFLPFLPFLFPAL